MVGSVPIPGAGNDGNTVDVWSSADGLHWGSAFDSAASRTILGKRKGGDTHGTFPHWKSRQSCVLKFVVAGDATVFSFVPAKS